MCKATAGDANLRPQEMGSGLDVSW